MVDWTPPTANEQPTENTPEFVPMYWIFFVDTTNPNPPTIFGKTAYKTDEGYFVVKVLAERVEGELNRLGRRLVTQDEYDLFLEEQGHNE